MISTRRFRLRFSSVSFGATGCDSPSPLALTVYGNPARAVISTSATASARRWDSSEPSPGPTSAVTEHVDPARSGRAQLRRDELDQLDRSRLSHALLPSNRTVSDTRTATPPGTGTVVTPGGVAVGSEGLVGTALGVVGVGAV